MRLRWFFGFFFFQASFYTVDLLDSRENFGFPQPCPSDIGQIAQGTYALRWLDLEGSCEAAVVRGQDWGRHRSPFGIPTIDRIVLDKLLPVGRGHTVCGLRLVGQ